MTKKSPALSEEEKALFRSHMEGVSPLHPSNKHLSPKTLPSERPKPYSSKHAAPSIPKTAIHFSSTYPTPVQSNTVLSFISHQLPQKRLRELKNGLIRWEAKLDLHGLHSDAAEHALSTFLTQQIQSNHRVLLIIHGKGGLDVNTPPILKTLVNHWLRQIPEVLAFHSAIPQDGGTGAVYVLLNRRTT